MKRFLGLCLMITLFSCANNSKTDAKLDSIKNYIDTTAEKIGDSIKAKSERLEDKIENKIKGRKDSADKDTAR